MAPRVLLIAVPRMQEFAADFIRQNGTRFLRKAIRLNQEHNDQAAKYFQFHNCRGSTLRFFVSSRLCLRQQAAVSRKGTKTQSAAKTTGNNSGQISCSRCKFARRENPYQPARDG